MWVLATQEGAMKMTEDLVRELDEQGVRYELIPHRRTMTAAEEAVAIGVPAADVGKTVVLTTPDGYVRVVLPASDRLDIHKARELLGGGKDTRLATEEELNRAYPMFELGAVPPFGGPEGDRVVVDRRLADHDAIVVEAGTHDESMQMPVAELIRLTDATIADVRLEHER